MSLSTYAKDVSIVGIWKLTNKERPFTCCSLSGYGATLKFTKDNTIELINKSPKLTDTTRHYSLKGNELNVYLKSKSVGFLGNLFMKNSSSNKTFTVNQISDKCFKAVQTKNHSNTFTMCKL